MPFLLVLFSHFALRTLMEEAIVATMHKLDILSIGPHYHLTFMNLIHSDIYL